MNNKTDNNFIKFFKFDFICNIVLIVLICDVTYNLCIEHWQTNNFFKTFYFLATAWLCNINNKICLSIIKYQYNDINKEIYIYKFFIFCYNLLQNLFIAIAVLIWII